MTQAAIEARKADLERQFREVEQQVKDLSNRLQAIHGAIQDCDYWLEQVTAEAQPPASA